MTEKEKERGRNLTRNNNNALKSDDIKTMNFHFFIYLVYNMTGSPVRSIKTQVKRLKVIPKDQFSTTGRQYLCTMGTVEGTYSTLHFLKQHFIPSKKALPILMVLGWLSLQQGACQPDEHIQILKSKTSIVFQRVGALYPTLNFAHIRVSANLTELQSVSVGICQSARLFAKLSN